MTDPTAETLRRAELAGGLTALQRTLHSSATVSDLFARASMEACGFCGFTRAAVLRVDDGRLTADGSTAIDNQECDALRLRVLATRPRLLAESEEAELIRSTELLTPGRGHPRSVLAGPLELQCYALAPILPESRVVGLLVLDRPGPAVDDSDRGLVGLFAHLLGLALERTVLRARLGELSSEVRHMTASANALLHEAVTAPVTATSDFGWGPVFPSAAAEASQDRTNIDEMLTQREREIVQLLVHGRSNRDIAEELHLAPDTIKANVARLLRKLGVSNRAEAVARYLTLGQTGEHIDDHTQ